METTWDKKYEKSRVEMNSTPFVRQYDILSNKWGAVQQKTLRGFYCVVGVDACIDPQADDEHPPLRINS